MGALIFAMRSKGFEAAERKRHGLDERKTDVQTFARSDFSAHSTGVRYAKCVVRTELVAAPSPAFC